ncbi:MAG: hypothetical protein J0H72_04410 [Burkholderiales bacterium]|nr:hypothetical protein [Burkholderiales bacterium]
MTPAMIPAILAGGSAECLIQELDPAHWVQLWPGFEVYSLWDDTPQGMAIGLFRCAKGVGSQRHRHDCNQFLYCLAGGYFYPDTGLRIQPGCFYMNPRGHAHGPAVALEDGTLMLEIYDGPATPLPA